MSRESETAQFTLRHSTNSLYLHEVPFSRSARHVLDPRTPENRLERSDDKSLDAGDGVVEGRNHLPVSRSEVFGGLHMPSHSGLYG